MKPDQPASPNNCMQRGLMHEDDEANTLSRRLTRLTWAVNLWGSITILLGVTLFLAGASIRGRSH